jgi:ribosomal protein S12 methylthiotransferase accessory factor
MLDLAERHRKVAESFDRCAPLAQTLALVPELRARYGITRIGDITRLDRIGIPTFCAIVPTSRTGLSVFNGKGATREAALASAVFEAVERETAASPWLQSRARPRDGTDCLDGRDLLNGRGVPVPLDTVHLRRPKDPSFPVPTSNGLASGNTLTEATYHALCELIERHVWSLYQMRCERLPRMLGGPAAADFAFAPEVTIPSGNADLDRLVECVTAQGFRLRIMYLHEPHFPAVMLASIVEEGSNPPMSHIGLGCSLSPVHAAIRAVTESAQSRLTDIHGARDDALRAGDAPTHGTEHTRRLSKAPKNVWFYDLPADAIDLESIADSSTNDLAEDVRRILSALARFGASSATVIELSPPDLSVKVVRAIVPELETTCVDGRIGPKAREALNPFGTIGAPVKRKSWTRHK